MQSGVINLLKSPGMSSSGGVVFLRGVLKRAGIDIRVGHAGTLDPGAAGVLPICIGRATRLSEYMMQSEKTYIAEVLFGVSTDTLDTYGTVTSRESCRVTLRQLEEVLPRFVGEIMQIPPVYSAVKIGGCASYKLARSGKPVSKPPRAVKIYSIELLSGEINRFKLRVTCSKGTYIRTLAEDIGKALSAPAVLSFLLREKSGWMEIANSYTVDEIKHMAEQRDFSFVRPADEVLAHLPRLDLPARAVGIKSGQSVRTKAQGTLRLYIDGEFLGVGEAAEGRVKLKVPLFELNKEINS